MSARAPAAGPPHDVSGAEPSAHEDPPAEEIIHHLERDQLVVETNRPLPRATLSRRAALLLWLLRSFAIIVSAMVVYTFIYQLH